MYKTNALTTVGKVPGSQEFRAEQTSPAAGNPALGVDPHSASSTDHPSASLTPYGSLNRGLGVWGMRLRQRATTLSSHDVSDIPKPQTKSLREWLLIATDKHLERAPKTQVPLEEQELFGVARWPKVCLPQYSESNNKQYGRAFCAESLRIGGCIGRKKYKAISHIWQACRSWRVRYDQDFGTKTKEFGMSRKGERMMRNTLIATNDRYSYMVPRIKNLPDTQSTVVTNNIHVGGKFQDIEAGSLQVSYVASTKLGDEKEIRLTELRSWFHEDGTDLRTPQSRQIVIGTMIHSDPAGLERLEVEANRLFQAVIEPNRHRQECIQMLGDLHWILAHAMLDPRGSAAKAEMSVRAIGYAVGIELPPFALGIVPDLEAFLTPREEFASRYAEFFSRPP